MFESNDDVMSSSDNVIGFDNSDVTKQSSVSPYWTSVDSIRGNNKKTKVKYKKRKPLQPKKKWSNQWTAK